MRNPLWQMMDRWLAERHPSELKQLVAESRLAEDVIEYGFSKAIEKGYLEWIEEFVVSLGSSLDRFSELPAVHCPLTYAMLNAGPATVKRLLALGADPNVLINREFYHRPLHVAVDFEGTAHIFLESGEIPAQFTELLLAYGADPLLLDVHGLSAVELAIRERHQVALRILERATEDKELKLRGMASLVQRLTFHSGGARELVSGGRLQDLEFLRAIVTIAAEKNFAEWVDDDLIRLGLWFLQLGALADAEDAARKASPSHPGRAGLLLGIANRLAQIDQTSRWRDLLSLAVGSLSSVTVARLRAQILMGAASLLCQVGDANEAERLLLDARSHLVESPSGPDRDQGLSDVAAQLSLIGARIEAFKTTNAIENWKLRWKIRTGRNGPKKLWE